VTFNRIWLAIAVQGTKTRRRIVAVARWIAWTIELAIKLVFSPIALLAGSRRNLVVLYDANVNPITYDFAWFLVAAELERRRRRLDGIHVILITPAKWRAWGESGEYNHLFSPEDIRWRFNNIIVALCQLLPHAPSVSILQSQTIARILATIFAWHTFPRRCVHLLPNRDYGRTYVFEQSYLGIDTHILQPPDGASHYVKEWLKQKVNGRRLITITLRQSRYGSERNSDILAWISFAKWLDQKRYAIVFIQDTEYAASFTLPEDVPAFVFPEATLDIRLRLALYTQAFMNLGVNNGPLIVAMFSSSPLSIVKQVVESVSQSSTALLRQHGFEPGHQPPFFSDQQHIFWDLNDDFDALCSAFTTMEARVAQESHEMASPIGDHRGEP